jgi:hypothetical protein
MRDFQDGTFVVFCACTAAADFGKIFWRNGKKEDIFNL